NGIERGQDLRLVPGFQLFLDGRNVELGSRGRVRRGRGCGLTGLGCALGWRGPQSRRQRGQRERCADEQGTRISDGHRWLRAKVRLLLLGQLMKLKAPPPPLPNIRLEL